jgi:hypothetical protein
MNIFSLIFLLKVIKSIVDDIQVEIEVVVGQEV